MDVRFELLDAAATTEAREEILVVYRDVFMLPPYNETEQDVVAYESRLLREFAEPGFRSVVARDGERMIGFAYGYMNVPGQRWRDRVSELLGPNASERWLSDSFGVVELGVVLEGRGQGIGGRLHDLLLRDVPARVALLDTLVGSDAMRLYRKRGWITLVEDTQFSPEGQHYAVLGLDLVRWRSGSG
jgi:GNAT superfamily N-acetyltransferase